MQKQVNKWQCLEARLLKVETVWLIISWYDTLNCARGASGRRKPELHRKRCLSARHAYRKRNKVYTLFFFFPLFVYIKRKFEKVQPLCECQGVVWALAINMVYGRAFLLHPCSHPLPDPD